jgi:hypothetical protein
MTNHKPCPVLTISIGRSHRRLAQLTLPWMERYAARIGADFEVIRDSTGHALPYMEKFRIHDRLEQYERILFLDDDVIVRPECPDLFALVPPGQFGAFLVHGYTDYHDGAITDIQAQLGDIGWKRTYFNSGVMVLSRQQRDVFQLDPRYRVEARFFPDQTVINYNVQRLKIPIFDIGYRFNHSTAPRNSAERFQSFIIHYPGKGHRAGSKEEQIALDLHELGLRAAPGRGARLVMSGWRRLRQLRARIAG